MRYRSAFIATLLIVIIIASLTTIQLGRLIPRYNITEYVLKTHTSTSTYTQTTSISYRDKVIALVNEIKNTLSTIRGLSFKEDVNIVLINTSWALEHWAPKESEGIPIDMVYKEVLYKTTFLVPYNFSIVSGTRSWTAMFLAAVAGSTMYINTDYFNPDESSSINVLAHELTHILQFQNFRISYEPRTLDSTLALQALIEGDAGFTQRLYCLKTGMCTPSPPTSIDLGNLYISLNLFPYVYGENFVKYLYNVYGNWSLVNKAYDNPPISTSLVIHPERYVLYLHNGGFRPENIEVKCYNATPNYEDTLGEYYLLLILAKRIGIQNASAVVEAWNGDRVALYLLSNTTYGRTWRICWNISTFSEKASEELYNAFKAFAVKEMKNLVEFDNKTFTAISASQIGDNVQVYHYMHVYRYGRYIAITFEYSERYTLCTSCG